MKNKPCLKGLLISLNFSANATAFPMQVIPDLRLLNAALLFAEWYWQNKGCFRGCCKGDSYRVTLNESFWSCITGIG